MDRKKANEYARRYREKNRKLLTEKQKIYREENKEELNKKQKDYYNKNKDKCLKYSKKYYQAHKAEHRKVCNKYYHNNQKRCVESTKKYRKKYPEKSRVWREGERARKKNNGGSFTSEEIKKLRKESLGFCKGYKREPHFVGEENLTIDHIIPLIKGGRNSIENIQLLCLSCNCSKGTN